MFHVLRLRESGAVLAGNVRKGQVQFRKQDYQPGTLVVKYTLKAGMSPSFKIAVDGNGIAHAGISSREDLYTPKNEVLASRIGVDRIYLPKAPPSTDVVPLAQRYSQDTDIEFANPDRELYPDVIPNDPLDPNHWGQSAKL